MARFGRVGPVLVIVEAITFRLTWTLGIHVAGNGPDP